MAWATRGCALAFAQRGVAAWAGQALRGYQLQGAHSQTARRRPHARACGACRNWAARPGSRERGSALSRSAASELQAQEARAGSPASLDGAIVLDPHLLSILEKLEEYITGSMRGTKGRVSAGHAEVAPRVPAPAKLFSQARGTLQGFSF